MSSHRFTIDIFPKEYYFFCANPEKLSFDEIPFIRFSDSLFEILPYASRCTYSCACISNTILRRYFNHHLEYRNSVSMINCIYSEHVEPKSLIYRQNPIAKDNLP